ncbi:MAG: CBS domain-containing protein, partial [Armatimonadetes bacterium]|nr:CBS domain-containing protein [Armatimonadota bacterium]
MLDTTAPAVPWRAGWDTAGALLLLFGSLPLSLCLADHGQLLALRAGEQSRLTGRYGARASRLAAWVDLAGPLHLTLLTCTGAWLLVRAWPYRPGAVVAVCVVRVLCELWLSRRWHEAPTRPLAAAAALWGPLLRPLLTLVARAEPEPLSPREEPANQALAEAIEVGDQEGELSVAETNLLRRELDFGRTVLGQVMVPWPRVERLHVHADFDEALRRLVASSHSRFPVCRADGAVVGVLHSKDLLPYLDQPLSNVLQVLSHRRTPAPLRLQVDVALDDALRLMRGARCSLAVAVDDAGRLVGVVAMEDLV